MYIVFYSCGLVWPGLVWSGLFVCSCAFKSAAACKTIGYVLSKSHSHRHAVLWFHALKINAPIR